MSDSGVSCDCSCDDCETCDKCDCAKDLHEDQAQLASLQSMLSALGSLGGGKNSADAACDRCNTADDNIHAKSFDDEIMGCESCVRSGVFLETLETFCKRTSAIEVSYVSKKEGVRGSKVFIDPILYTPDIIALPFIQALVMFRTEETPRACYTLAVAGLQCQCLQCTRNRILDYDDWLERL